MHRRADRDRTRWGRVRTGRLLGEVQGGTNGCGLMPRSADPAEEQADDLIADDLVHDAVVRLDCLRPQPVEEVQEGMERRRSQPLAERRRPTDVGEEQGHGDLDAAEPLLAQGDGALHAQGRVAGRAAEAGRLEQQGAESAERRGAQLAARGRRDVPEYAPLMVKARALPRQEGPDRLRRHATLVAHDPENTLGLRPPVVGESWPCEQGSPFARHPPGD